MKAVSHNLHLIVQCLTVSLLCWLPVATTNAAEDYTVPRNEFGQPDIAGTWAYESLTFFERPGAFQDLVVTAEQAQPFINGFLADTANLGDPDTLIGEVNSLMQVNGEYRTSVVTEPATGKLPLSAEGEAVRGQYRTQRENLGGPEALDLDERCLGSLGYPPLKTFIVSIPTKIIQTSNYVMLKTEDPTVARIVRLSDEHKAVGHRSLAGSSTGKWEGETLVITSSHFREDEVMRLSIPGGFIIGPDAVITEHFTRLSDSQMHYEFTVDDAQHYSQSWSGEFIMSAIEDSLYEYSCHEGNYSLPGILAGKLRQEIEAEVD